MPIIWVTRSVIGLSRLLMGRAFGLARKKKRRPRPVLYFPVAGIEEPEAQSVLYSLTKAAQGDEDIEVSRIWLTALQLTQAISDRLLQDLLVINDSLSYWQNSMAQGSHFWSMFLRNGPLMFYKKIRALIERTEIEEKSATDMIEARVLILRNLDGMVSTALGQVQEIADQLRLRQEDEDDDAGVPSENKAQQERELTNSARIAIQKACSILVQLVKTLQDNVTGFSEFRQAQSHLKEIAMEQTRKGPMKLPSMIERYPQTLESTDISNRVPDISNLREWIVEVEALLGVGFAKNQQQTASNALAETAVVVAESPQIIVVPKWAKCPTLLEQKWLEYTVGGAFGIWCFSWILFHSPLTGSRAMYNWANSIKFAFLEHVLGPLKALRGKLFQTFRNTPSIVSREEYDVSYNSLHRMLEQFEKDHRRTVQRLPPMGNGVVATGEIAGMITLMRVYENELKNPIWNVITGGLARALLIQVQKLKTDVEAAMLQLDSILSANELNVAMIAAIPSVLIAGGLLYLVVQRIRNSGPDPFISTTPCRLNLVELERIFSEYEKGQMTQMAEGFIVHRLYKVYASCWLVFKNRDRTSSQSEWPSMRRDMIDLARRDITIKKKLQLCARMRSTYTVFQLPRK